MAIISSDLLEAFMNGVDATRNGGGVSQTVTEGVVPPTVIKAPSMMLR